MDRTFGLRWLVVLALGAVTFSAGGCRDRSETRTTGSASSQPSAGQQQERHQADDQAITTRVQAKFFKDAQVKQSDVAVRSEGGVVTLEGTVPSDDVKQQAIRAAKDVDGVQRVQDHLRVQQTQAQAASPDEQKGAGERVEGTAGRAESAIRSGWVTTKVQSQYFADPDVKGRNIDVDTANGVVTLSGTVDSERARQRAVEIARQTEGVTRVDDKLKVAAAGQPAATAESTTAPGLSDEELAARIESKYYADDQLRGIQVDVRAAGGVVTLTGAVQSDAVREQAEAVARNTNGVKRVDNQLTVSPPTEGVKPVEGRVRPGAEQGQATGTSGGLQQRNLAERIDDAWITTSIQSRFFLDDRVRNGSVNVVTHDGTVTLTGTLPDSAAKHQAVQLAKTTAGVAQVVDKITLAAQRH